MKRNAAEQQLLTQAFIDGFFAGNDDSTDPIAVAYPNRLFNQPQSGTWGRFSIRSGKVTDAAINGLVVRGVGVVYLQLFTPTNGGEIDARTLGDLFASAMDRKTLRYLAEGTDAGGEIRLHRASTEFVGYRNGYNQFNCTIDYWHDRMEAAAYP